MERRVTGYLIRTRLICAYSLDQSLNGSAALRDDQSLIDSRRCCLRQSFRPYMN
jgi:hypothetical protein